MKKSIIYLVLSLMLINIGATRINASNAINCEYQSIAFEYTTDDFESDKDLYIGEMHLFPNPAKDNVVIEFNSITSKTVQVEMINIIGQTMNQQSWTLENGINRLELNILEFPTGSYFLRVMDSKNCITKKFSVEH